jgi:hypothetical protein
MVRIFIYKSRQILKFNYMSRHKQDLAIADNRVQSQPAVCQVCSGPSVTETGFPPSTLVTSRQCRSTNSTHSVVHHERCRSSVIYSVDK